MLTVSTGHEGIIMDQAAVIARTLRDASPELLADLRRSAAISARLTGSVGAFHSVSNSDGTEWCVYVSAEEAREILAEGEPV